MLNRIKQKQSNRSTLNSGLVRVITMIKNLLPFKCFYSYIIDTTWTCSTAITHYGSNLQNETYYVPWYISSRVILRIVFYVIG